MTMLHFPPWLDSALTAVMVVVAVVAGVVTLLFAVISWPFRQMPAWSWIFLAGVTVGAAAEMLLLLAILIDGAP